MLLHTSNGFEYDSEKPMRVSFVLRYAGDNPKYVAVRLDYKNKSQIKVQGVFRYIENIPHGESTFLYSNEEYLGKYKTKPLEELISDIYVESERSIEVHSDLINIISNKTLKSSNNILQKDRALTLQDLRSTSPVEKSLNRMLRADSVLMEKSLDKMLKIGPTLIQKDIYKLLKLPPRLISESSSKGLKGQIRDIVIEHPLEVQDMDLVQLGIVYKTQGLAVPHKTNIAIEHPLEVINLENLKSISIENNNPLLSIALRSKIAKECITQTLLIAKNLKLLKEDTRLLDRSITKTFELNKFEGLKLYHKENLRSMQKILITPLVNYNNLKNAEKYKGASLKTRVNKQVIHKDKVRLFHKEEIKNIKKGNSKLVSRINLTNGFRDLFYKGLVKKSWGLYKSSNRFFRNVSLVNMSKQPQLKFLKRQVPFDISQFKETFLKKESLISLDRDTTIKPVYKEIAIYPIFKNSTSYVNKIVVFPMGKMKYKPLSRQENIPVTLNEIKPLSSKDIRRISHPELISSIEIIKRWWVIPPGSERDKKILPPDYNYSTNPLIGSPGVGYVRMVFPEGSDQNKLINDVVENMRVRYFLEKHRIIPYEYIPKIYTCHPNSQSINPYIEHNDKERGLYEMPLAINIIIEMVNLVALIVHHQATQLCYCTGQEAMWFIMEMLDDWLNLDSTLQQFNSLGATEHYHRTYRWIRWEAEKVYFNCEAENRFMGLKYAGQLLANLIEYMKYHHFNVVPLWKDLSRMDYWRNQTNKYNNPANDIIIELDKVKGKRHLNIETQRLDKKALEGMPKIK